MKRKLAFVCALLLVSIGAAGCFEPAPAPQSTGIPAGYCIGYGTDDDLHFVPCDEPTTTSTTKPDVECMAVDVCEGV